MAYENYSFVSWTAGTPISSDRLGQMSTNIGQVKDATDDNPKGIIKLKTVSGSTFGPFSSWNTEHEIISLENEGGSGVNNLVTVGANRYYRLTLSFPGISILNAGAEDSTYLITLNEGTTSAPIVLSTWKATAGPFTFVDTATANANIANEKLKSTSFPTRIAAGTYSTIFDSTSSGITNKRYYIGITRDDGSTQNNNPTFQILTSDAKMQFYAEDIGGSV
jgi:hypothetical protein